MARANPRLALAATLLVVGTSVFGAESNEPPLNLLPNPGFENGRVAWGLSKAGNTVAKLTFSEGETVQGRYCAKVDVGAVEEWGVQLGARMDAGRKGKTYTFAAFAKSGKGHTEVYLRVERNGKPWDAAGQAYNLDIGETWKEHHVTFTVKRDFPDGWIAMIGCSKPDSVYMADMCRLYEGEYAPYKEPARESGVSNGIQLYDTGTSAPASLSPDDLRQKNGWTRVQQPAHEFKGDAVCMNTALVIVLRRGGQGAELYGLGADGPNLRCALAPLADSAPNGLTSLKAARNTPGNITFEATGKSATGKNMGLRCEMQAGQYFVKTSPIGAATRLKVQAPARFAVLPDFFADDIVADAARINSQTAELPCDNFLLQLSGRGEAIVASVWKTPGEDVQIELAGEGTSRLIQASEIPFGAGEPVWVALLEGEGIWHAHEVRKEDRDKIIRLDWTAPFQALWRTDWQTDRGVIDSWEMAVEQESGSFLKPGWFGQPATLPPDRKRWTTVLGEFKYPCWIDRSGRGFLHPLKSVLAFQGPAVVYPINRDVKTPLDRRTFVDVLRDTLGMGPCEYILDVEAQAVTWGGMATCGAREKLNAIYAKGEQKKKRDEVQKALDDVTGFVKFIRAKIDAYVDFGHAMLRIIGQQKKLHPELAEPLRELETPLTAIDAAVAQRQDKIKTTEYTVRMIEEFRRGMIDYEGPDAADKCREFTKALVEIGGNQDNLVGECRWAVRMLRQRAGLALSSDPRLREISSGIRQRTTEMLRNPAGHEAPRH